ncbi:zinc metallopeptidase [Clostridium botulinum C]|uniref:Zinc metallopeptidase n=3 Tax=Clostridium botulinum TaxID=1491 RepID=A0A9Q4TI81_CLOBO|nr:MULTISPECIES: zinc metallopeptidase [Clostridium]EGO88505.1 peptidase [Clostridium botulinum C str. Stockholm]EES90906.1 neutral zinc metallopeptidase [Clostridium botulinum D str. 1873]KEI10344.1 peptidase [Clostridium sp. K25]MBO3441816.1 zinc metallopeptidase [Clostridium haemolyticum]MCD3194399.1 zinc metallopeptidase [Clostridium botulinum C]
MFWFYDKTMVILIPALIISAWAQLKVSSTFNKFSNVRSINGYTGAQVARMLLDAEGLYDIPVQEISGKLTDHYDPRNRVMRLSTDVYHGTSVASIGVAAHETGHAIQHKKHYAPLEMRNSIVPVVNFSSSASWIIFMIGLFIKSSGLIQIGIILFSAVVIFQLITLPVEFNASNRALKILENRNILYGDEIRGARSVLSAAAMTYVAAALTAILELVRLIAISKDE